MEYWKLLNPDGSINSVESHSYPHIVPGAIEITKAEYDAFIASLPPPEPEPLTPDELRLQEIISNPVEALTMPEVWEAIRILARLRGIEGAP